MPPGRVAPRRQRQGPGPPTGRHARRRPRRPDPANLVAPGGKSGSTRRAGNPAAAATTVRKDPVSASRTAVTTLNISASAKIPAGATRAAARSAAVSSGEGASPAGPAAVPDGGAVAPAAPNAPRAALTAAVQAAAAATAPGPLQAAILAAQAYIYGYPLLEYERVRSTAGGLNTIYSLTSFANPDVDPIWQAIGGGKRPNTDTFYSVAELDLTNGPVVLSIPDMGTRYFSFQLTDPYTNVSGYIGSRTTGYGPGKYAITWADGPQVSVPDAQTVVVPYASMLMLGRTLAGNIADQQSAIALMKQYSLDPTGATGPNDAIVPASRSSIDVLNAMSAAMAQNPPPAEDAPELAKLARIGVGPGLQVADAHLSLLSRLAVDAAVTLTAALLPALANLTQLGSAIQHGGWAIPNSNIGNYGTDYLLRAGVAEVGLVANTPDEAMYEAGLLDRNLLPLSGFSSYKVHFAPGEAPPADAFWSVTVYNATGGLVQNPERRYSVSSSRPDELVYQPDGSIDIVLSRSDPHDPNVNWLPVPAGGGFSAYLRIYVPEQSALDLAWLPPRITPLPPYRWRPKESPVKPTLIG